MTHVPPLTAEDWVRARETPKKPEVMAEQRLPVCYHVEHPEVKDRPRRFLEVFAAILKHTNYRFVLDHYARTQAKCGRCAVACHVYQATGRPEDIPCYRSELLLSVYRRHFTLGGLVRGRLLGDAGLTDEAIEAMAESLWDCTACRRCQLECPSGIDHGLVVHLGRYILSELGIAPRALVVSTREQLEGKTGNTSAIPVPALIDSLEFLTEEIEEDKGVAVPFPIDEQGAEYLFIPAVSDFMMEADTLMGIAVTMHAAGVSWTIGTENYDAINYGLFYSDHVLEHVLRKMRREAERLGVKAIVIGECGHASRSAKFFYPCFCGGDDALPIINIMELTQQLIREGRLKPKPGAVTERVTYHDPCNIARSGWIVDQPREILRTFCSDFVEMATPGRRNLCCGGGGGTVSIDEIRPYRTTIGGRAKAAQLRATGAQYVVAPCANCKKQLRELVEDQKLDCEIVGLHDLIYKAIDLSSAGEAEVAETAGTTAEAGA